MFVQHAIPKSSSKSRSETNGKKFVTTFKLFHINFFFCYNNNKHKIFERLCVCGYHSLWMSSPFYLNVCSTFFGCRFGAIFELCFLSLLPYIFHRIMRQGREHRVPRPCPPRSGERELEVYTHAGI